MTVAAAGAPSAALARRHAVRQPSAPDVALKAHVLTIAKNLLRLYGDTDFTAAYADEVIAKPDEPANGNVMAIPLAQASAYLVEFELDGHDSARFDKAVDLLTTVVELHPYWGRNWISAPVANYLAIVGYRLNAEDGLSDDQRRRVAALWQQIRALLRTEAETSMACVVVPGNGCQSLPFLPLDSSATGDSKAEEDAWEASLLAAAAVFNADAPESAAWNEKAREIAWDAITRPSDPPDASGVKTVTVAEDFSLGNHAFTPNGMYTAATIELLQQGALPYRLTGAATPEEFTHNVDALYAKYLENVVEDAHGQPHWIAPCDEGDPTDMPLSMGDGRDERWAQWKAASGYLFDAEATPQPSISSGDALWIAIQDHKVMWRYTVNVYLWR